MLPLGLTNSCTEFFVVVVVAAAVVVLAAAVLAVPAVHEINPEAVSHLPALLGHGLAAAALFQQPVDKSFAPIRSGPSCQAW